MWGKKSQHIFFFFEAAKLFKTIKDHHSFSIIALVERLGLYLRFRKTLKDENG